MIESQADFEVGHKVLVAHFQKPGRVASKSTDARGRTFYGIVYDDPEKAVTRRRNTVDVYVERRHLQALDSQVTFASEEPCS